MIAAIENAILARVRAASDAGVFGYKFKTLETYPAEWDSYLKEKGPIAAPAFWVTFAGIRPLGELEAGRPYDRYSFGVVVMAENARNETATRQGGPVPAEPGSYQLAEDVRAVLRGRDLGLSIGGLKAGALHIVGRLAAVQERKVSMLAQEFTTDILEDEGAAFDDEPIGDFSTFHADWDLPPHGGIDADPDTPGVQLPDDAHADAIDHVHLETAP